MSTREKLKRAAGLFLVALILGLCTTPQFRAFVTFPDHVRLPQGETQDFVFRLPLSVTVRTNHVGALAVNGQPIGFVGQKAGLLTPFSIGAIKTGRYKVDLRLFGLIPFRQMTVDVVPPVRLVPGGHSIGVLLRSRGVIVVGYAAIRNESGLVCQPARDAGIEVGDAIVEIDGLDVTSEAMTVRLFELAGKAGRPVRVTVRRQGRLHQKLVTPVRDKESGRTRVGLYIRDGAAGVGTLTFYEPKSGKYGALGHVIADAETSQPIEVRDGHIVHAEVTSIQKGRKGAPGEKVSSLKNEDNWLGTVEKNTRFGIFGSMHTPIGNPLFRDPLPAAMASQVKEGAAEILTVVQGQRLERFRVEILRVMRQPTQDGKNMIVRVTDPRLLDRTGGIVQGMSGSPILQDGRIVGAVTHVFVNDPTRGYGALIEWMLQEAGVFGRSDESNLRGSSRSLFMAV